MEAANKPTKESVLSRSDAVPLISCLALRRRRELKGLFATGSILEPLIRRSSWRLQT